jgi:hypothetical protein
MSEVELFRPYHEMKELRLLQELENNPIVSQRDLSMKLGLALGATNACLRTMARRGCIRIMNFNRGKIGYFLTPKGHSEKDRMATDVVSWTVQYYSAIKEMVARRLLEMERLGVRRIVFYGVSDEMEIAYMTLQNVDLKLVGIVEDQEKVKTKIIFGFELEPVSRVRELKPDGVLITSLKGSSERRDRLRALCDSNQIHVSDMCSAFTGKASL